MAMTSVSACRVGACSGDAEEVRGEEDAGSTSEVAHRDCTDDDTDEEGSELGDGDTPRDGESHSASEGQTLGLVAPFGRHNPSSHSTVTHTAVLPEPSSATRLDDSPAVLACSPTSLSAAHSPSRHAQHIAGSCGSSRRPKAPKNPGKHSSPAGRSQRLRDAQDALALTSKLVSLKPVKKRDAPVSVPNNVATDAPVDASAFTVRGHGACPTMWLRDIAIYAGFLMRIDGLKEHASLDAEGRLLGLLGGKPSEQELNGWRSGVLAQRVRMRKGDELVGSVAAFSLSRKFPP
ncbi:hypothetical protein BDZ89DRAFT_1054852 [Hymenopellis radicata]|nr:hypothetical protein BDZ89DRAFT_1054852 [Hymenopellis radicata]